MTRGRDNNHAYVVTEDNQTAHDVLTQALSRDWIDIPAFARQAQLDPHLARQLVPNGPGDQDRVDELVRRARRRIAERKAQRREVERTRQPTLGR